MYTREIKSLHCILIKLFFWGIFCTLNLYGEEYVGSHITKETRWTASEGPYIIERDLVIDKGANLTISPGVVVIIKMPKVYDTIEQYDRTDSQMISIKVKGSLNCIGRPNNHVIFSSTVSENSYGWYGIVFDGSPDNFTEIAYTDITNAFRGLSARNCSPIIRNCILSYNHIGIYCSVGGNAQIYNCIITNNFSSGIHTRQSNPHIANNIIAFNKNNGVLCDGSSMIKLEYNCLYGNADGNYLDCDPQLGQIVISKKNKDSTDFAHNIYNNPIFAGSEADSLSQEKDLSIPTKTSQVRDTALAHVYYSDKPQDTSTPKPRKYKKFELSSYSPCINKGSPDSKFKNTDGKRNTMGIWGGPEFFGAKK